MSLALPYPSMVFVPLDVLTADEMNHIVANYEFIANQFPITSDNIDSTTLYPLIQSGTHYITSAAWETIQFPHAFDSIPHVAASLNTQNAETQTATWIKIAHVSKTGFRAAVGVASGYGTGQVDWIASVI